MLLSACLHGRSHESRTCWRLDSHLICCYNLRGLIRRLHQLWVTLLFDCLFLLQWMKMQWMAPWRCVLMAMWGRRFECRVSLSPSKVSEKEGLVSFSSNVELSLSVFQLSSHHSLPIFLLCRRMRLARRSSFADEKFFFTAWYDWPPKHPSALESTAKTAPSPCANIPCHYFILPVWGENYPPGPWGKDPVAREESRQSKQFFSCLVKGLRPCIIFFPSLFLSSSAAVCFCYFLLQLEACLVDCIWGSFFVMHYRVFVYLASAPLCSNIKWLHFSLAKHSGKASPQSAKPAHHFATGSTIFVRAHTCLIAVSS